MNPLLVSAAFGFVKGYVVARKNPSAPLGNWAMHSLAGPFVEELVYRAAPMQRGMAGLPNGWTGLPFAMDHVQAEAARGVHSTAGMFGRFADVFAGGVLYEAAYRQWGFLGAFGAHLLHNTMHGFGMRAARRGR